MFVWGILLFRFKLRECRRYATEIWKESYLTDFIAAHLNPVFHRSGRKNATGILAKISKNLKISILAWIILSELPGELG